MSESIYGEYITLTTKYKKLYGERTIVLLQVGAFFEVYGLKTKTGEIIGSDIEHFSQTNDLIIATKSNMKPGDGMTVLMAGFGLAPLEKYVKKYKIDMNRLILNNDVTGTPTESAGIEVERGLLPNVQFRWNETDDKWQIQNASGNYLDIATTLDASPAGLPFILMSNTQQ